MQKYEQEWTKMKFEIWDHGQYLEFWKIPQKCTCDPTI